MSTVNQLTADLQTLLNESKRRNSDIKHASELALTKLKSYQPNQPVSQLNNLDKSIVLKPFLISCNTNNARFANLAIPAIHKLIIFNAIVSTDLSDILKSLLEATHLAIDIQLRILQCLPSLMQNYSSLISGQTLLSLLSICASLTSNNKSTVVINTASATLQQLFSNIYDKLPVTNDPGKGTTTNSITIDNDKAIIVDDLCYEGFQIFQDLCKLTDNEAPTYFPDLSQIKFNSVLEIIENIISSHKDLFNNHEELGYLLRIKLIPSLLRLLNTNSKTFPLTIRAMRILLVLLNSQLDNLIIEGEIVLSILNHILLNNESTVSDSTYSELDSSDTSSTAGNIYWERFLVLEIFKGLFSNFTIIKKIFTLYDMNPKKKNVIKETFSILTTYLQKNPILIRDIIQIPSPGSSSSGLYLSKQTSLIKIAMLDLLDKTDPPSNIPVTYPIYLIHNILLSFTDGIAKFVNNISSTASDDLESDIEFINGLIESTYTNTSQLFKFFIYSLMDNEHYHMLIRCLQKFTHTTGLLGLNSLRDGLLTLLAECIIKQETSANDSGSSGSTSNGSNDLGTGLKEQGKSLLALGESIVESLTNSELNLTASVNTNDIKKTRNYNFNSRHVTCLRALINLAISLGSTLSKSWRIIWITLQWCDYYINGLNEFSGINKKNEDANHISKLTQQDIANIRNSITKFYDSITDYPVDSYEELLDSLMDLFQIGSGTIDEDIEHDRLIPCPYNKVYFIDKLFDISRINSTKYVLENGNIFLKLSKFFIKFGVHGDADEKLNANFNFKQYIVIKFTDIVKTLAIDSANLDLHSFNTINNLCLTGLNNIITALNDIAFEPQELLIINNNKIELHLIVLQTLTEIMENYNKSLTVDDSWDIMFRIINNPFTFNTLLDEINDTLKDKINILINSSFNCLKLILNEFISTLPVTKFKILIDSLYNFGLQGNDLNISFSSISYYWLISDAIKSKFKNLKSDDDAFPVTEEKLIRVIENVNSQTNSQTDKELDTFYKSLDIYLLLSLIKLSGDLRAQVRNGSIQTVFEIIDIHGNLFNKVQWELIYNIVLVKFFTVNPDLSVHEMKETITLKLEGLISVYNKFAMNFQVKFWQKLVDYFYDLIKMNKLEINIIILKKFNDLLLIDTSDKIVNESFYGFWINIPIEYDFNNPDLYIEQLEQMMINFPLVYNKISESISPNQVSVILNTFMKVLRYPIILNKLDDKNPSFLQSKIIENIQILANQPNNKENGDEILSIIIRELSNILVYQFKIRQRIENKLNNSNLKQKYKLPTFISIGNLAFELLEQLLHHNVQDINILIQDGTIIRLLSSDLDLIKTKTLGNNSQKPLWIECNKMVIEIIEKIMATGNINQDIWAIILQTINIILTSNNSKGEEMKNIEQYFSLIQLIMPKLTDKAIIGHFLKDLYYNSYLYEFNELEQEILASTTIDKNGSSTTTDDDVITKDDMETSSTGNVTEEIKNLVNYNFDNSFGSTKPIIFYKFNKIKLTCLKELIHYTNYQDDKFNGIAIKFFLARLAFTLRRLIEDEKLIYKMPISTIQTQELTLLLQGLLTYVQKEQNQSDEIYQLIKGVVNLLIKFLPFSYKFSDINQLVESILMAFNNRLD